jgi:hypothetical protein
MESGVASRRAAAQRARTSSKPRRLREPGGQLAQFDQGHVAIAHLAEGVVQVLDPLAMPAERLLPQDRPEEPEGLAEALRRDAEVVDSLLRVRAARLRNLLQEIQEDRPQDLR